MEKGFGCFLLIVIALFFIFPSCIAGTFYGCDTMYTTGKLMQEEEKIKDNLGVEELHISKPLREQLWDATQHKRESWSWIIYKQNLSRHTSLETIVKYEKACLVIEKAEERLSKGINDPFTPSEMLEIKKEAELRAVEHEPEINKKWHAHMESIKTPTKIELDKIEVIKEIEALIYKKISNTLGPNRNLVIKGNFPEFLEIIGENATFTGEVEYAKTPTEHTTRWLVVKLRRQEGEWKVISVTSPVKKP